MNDKSRDKQIDMITELLTDFDEMGFAPTTLCPDPEAYAIGWRKKLTEELKGCRKASDVARELFEEIEKIIDKHYNKHIFGSNDLEDEEKEAVINFSDDVTYDIDELKKKYTEDGE